VKPVEIYTDGSCLGNPGPGGYGVVLLHDGQRRELQGGFRRTTNNRMEILAAIKGLEALQAWPTPAGEAPPRVTLYSDSQYVVRAMSEGWARRWRANGWRRNKTEAALNPDLWDVLLRLTEAHQVEFRWLRGHVGHPENERCDRLAVEAAKRSSLPADDAYERQGGRRP